MAVVIGVGAASVGGEFSSGSSCGWIDLRSWTAIALVKWYELAIAPGTMRDRQAAILRVAACPMRGRYGSYTCTVVAQSCGARLPHHPADLPAYQRGLLPESAGCTAVTKTRRFVREGIAQTGFWISNATDGRNSLDQTNVYGGDKGRAIQ